MPPCPGPSEPGVHAAGEPGVRRQSLDDRPELLGRPSRDGRLALQVEMADPAAGHLLVRATDRASGGTAWPQTVQADAAIVHVVLLDSDRPGNVYIAAEVGRESSDPPYDLQDVHTIVAPVGRSS